MLGSGIPLDKAELLSVLLEGILYGFSLLMFSQTIWILFSRRSTHRVNRKMFTVACLLLVLSTTHLVIHIIRVMEGLVLYRDTYQGGPVAYFSDVLQWTFLLKNHVYTVQTLLGDGVILYRCYMVWQSMLVMIVPVLLWTAAGVTGIMATYTAQHVKQNGVFGGTLSLWITAFWASALATNLLATFLLLVRIWRVDSKAARMLGHRNSQLRTMLHILIDAGVIYSLTLLVALVCFVTQTNGQCVVLDMVTPIISITFYMVIVRVGLSCRPKAPTSMPLPNMSADISFSMDQKHVTMLTESNIKNKKSFPMDPIITIKKRESEIRFVGMDVV